MPRRVPRRSLHAARAAGLFFLRPHRQDTPTLPPPAPPETTPAEAEIWVRPAFDSLSRVTTVVYEAGRFEAPSGAVSTTCYDASRTPAPMPAPLGRVTTYVYDPVGGTARPLDHGAGPD